MINYVSKTFCSSIISAFCLILCHILRNCAYFVLQEHYFCSSEKGFINNFWETTKAQTNKLGVSDTFLTQQIFSLKEHFHELTLPQTLYIKK